MAITTDTKEQEMPIGTVEPVEGLAPAVPVERNIYGQEVHPLRRPHTSFDSERLSSPSVTTGTFIPPYFKDELIGWEHDKSIIRDKWSSKNYPEPDKATQIHEALRNWDNIYGWGLPEKGYSEEDIAQERRLYKDRVLKQEQIPGYSSMADAYNSSALLSGETFAIIPSDPNLYPKFYTRDKRPAEDLVTHSSQMLAGLGKIWDSYGPEGKAGDSAVSILGGIGEGGMGMMKIFPEIALQAYPYLEMPRYDETKPSGIKLGHEYWPLAFAGVKSLLVDDPEIWEKGLLKFEDETDARKNQVADLYSKYKDYSSQVENAWRTLDAFRGIDYRKRFDGRLAQIFTEEFTIYRALAFIKFRKAKGMFKGFAENDLDSADSVAKALGMVDKTNVPTSAGLKKAQKMLDKHKEGTDPTLRALYLAHENDAAWGFAIGWTAMQQMLGGVGPDGKPVENDGLNMALMLGSGFGGAIIGGPRGLKKRGLKHRWKLYSVLYQMSDFLTRAKIPPVVDTKIIATNLREKHPAMSTQDIEQRASEISRMRTMADNKKRLKRTKKYLQGRGLNPQQIKQLENEGGIDELAGQYLFNEDLGDVQKFYRAFQEMPEGILKQDTAEMVEASFDALHDIVLFGRKNLGLDVNIFMDNLINLASFQQIKQDLLYSQGPGFLSDLYKGSFIRSRLNEMKRNEAMLQDSLAGYIQQLSKYMENPRKGEILSLAEMSDVAVERGHHFMAWAHDTAQSIYNKSKIADENLLAQFMIEGDAINKMSNKARLYADTIISPRIELGPRVRAAERLFYGTEDGARVIQKRLGGVERKGILQQDLEEPSRLFEELLKYDIRFDADSLYEGIKRTHFNNDEVVEEIFDYIGQGLSGTRRVFRALGTRYVGEMTVQDLPELYDIIRKTKTDPDDITAFDDALLDRSGNPLPDNEQLEVLKRMSRGLSPQQKLDLLPKEMTMKEVTGLLTHFSRQAFEASGSPRGQAYKTVQDFIHDMLDYHAKNIDPSIVEDYTKARLLWKEYSNRWKRGPLHRSTSTNALGERLTPIEGLFDSFLDPNSQTGIYQSSEVFRKLRMGSPVGIENIKRNDEGDVIDYDVKYKPYTINEKAAIDDLMREAISRSIRHGKINISNADDIMTQYKGLLNGQQREAFSTHIRHIFGYMDEVIDTQKNLSESLRNNLKEIVGIKRSEHEGSLFAKIGAMTKGTVAPNEIVELLLRTRSVKSHELTTTQAELYVDLNRRARETFGEVSEARVAKIEAATQDIISGAKETEDLMMTSLDYIRLLTDDFTLVGKNGKQIGKKVKEDLDAMFLNYMVSNTIKPINAKIVREGKLGYSKTVDSDKFHTIYEEIGHARKHILGVDENDILAKAYEGTIGVLPFGQITEGAMGFDIPRPIKMQSVISRYYSWRRGVVGLRYLLGEAGVRELRKGQATQLRNLLTDPDAAQLFTALVKDKTPKDLQSPYGPFKSATRALAYVTGLKVTEVNLLFDEEAKLAFLFEGKMLSSVLGKVIRAGTARKKWKDLYGSKPSEREIEFLKKFEETQSAKKRMLREKAGYITPEESRELNLQRDDAIPDTSERAII